MKKVILLAIIAMACSFVSCEQNGQNASGVENATSRKVETGNVYDITATTATIIGSINIDMSEFQDVAFGIMFSENKEEVSVRKGNRNEAPYLNDKEFEVEIKGLMPQTMYYYCAWLFLNGKQYLYGDIKQFETLEGNAIGEFSISNSTKVTFSKGNLQYHPANDEWRFAPSQLDYIGKANQNISSTYNGWLDLFGWSTSSTNFGVSISIDDYHYGSFVDWGTNKIGDDAPNTWRTLTCKEWIYVVFDRPNASSLCGVAQVNDVNGLILLPDYWTCPSGVTFKSGFHYNYGVDYYAAYQTFTAAEWSKLESAGAVFLPAAGDRYVSGVDDVQDIGRYWSATEYNSINAFCLRFRSDEAGMGGSGSDYGQSVRLVKDL